MNKIFSIVILASLLLASVAPRALSSPGPLALPLPVSQTERKEFSFGPGTERSRSHYRTLYVPPNTSIGVAVELSTEGNQSVPVTIEVRQASATSLGTEGPDGPLLDSQNVTAPRLATFTRNFSSNFGCPNTWRVRVKTQNGQPPPVKVFGNIVFVYTVPPTSKLAMAGNAFDLSPNVTVTRSLSNITVNSTGIVRLRAKWHTDPLDLANLNTFHRLRVQLLRPDGSVAAALDGFSLHGDRTPRLDFTYNVTAADAIQSGTWQIRVRNISNVKIVGFLIEKGIDPNPFVPNFHSSFTPKCF